MANYTTTANIILQVNGKQAQKMLDEQIKRANKLQKDLQAASTAMDKVKMKAIQRELNATKHLIEQLQGSARSAEVVLSRLDKASPRELNKTLRTLQSQLNGIQRGSAAWDAQVAKIKAVKAELAKVNATMVAQKSMWSRFNSWLNNTQTAIMGVVAGLTGLIMAGRSAVKHYADMEEAMANTRKYTRMTKEDVAALNEIFLKTDTRLTRQELNLLAQEGGRLGYNTLQNVREYVEAATTIKVALVDLGEGATQTIAKISNIFGVEELYGVRDAMLKVGSTVNHLSQNCTASKPYIVEFAQRMAGIGSTAKMTIPEIMAFAATLDAHGQKVEMSASALSRLIMKLFNDPAELAQKVGLKVNYFMKVLNNDVTKGVMMFLEQLNKIGDKDALAALSPLFKDMGMDGVRMAQVLSNLATHLDFLKWQLGEANQAFREGTSASNEYAIFNNTVQAQIEKAKYTVYELSVTLGEKLYPVMKHIYTSSSAFMRVLNVLVDFFIEHRKVILSLVVAFTSYYVALGVVKVAKAAWIALTTLGTTVMTAFQYAIGLCRVAVIAFTHGLTGASRAFKALNAAMSMSAFGAIATVVATLTVTIYNLVKGVETATDRMKKATKQASDYSEQLVKEKTELDILFGTLRGASEGTEQYSRAKQTLIDQYGRYLTGLIDEKGAIIDLEAAYKRLSVAVERSVAMRGIKNAEQTVIDEFSTDFANTLNKLRENLTFFGQDAAKAAEVTAQVAESLMGGKAMPKAASDYISEMSAKWYGGSTAWDKVNSSINNFPGMKQLNNSLGWEVKSPQDLLVELQGLVSEKKSSLTSLNSMKNAINPYDAVPVKSLELAVSNLTKITEEKKNAETHIFIEGKGWEKRMVTVEQAKELIKKYTEEIALKGGPSAVREQEELRDYPDIDRGGDGGSAKDRFANEDNHRAVREAHAAINKANRQRKNKKGKWVPYTQADYEYDMADIEADYYEEILKRRDLNWQERLQMDAKYQQALAKKAKLRGEEELADENERHTKMLVSLHKFYAKNKVSQKSYNKALEDEELMHLAKLRKIARNKAFARQDEWRAKMERGEATAADEPDFDPEAYNAFMVANEAYLSRGNQIISRRNADRERDEQAKQREQERHNKDLDKVRDTLFLPEEANQRNYMEELGLLDEVYNRELALAGDNAERKLELEQALTIAKIALAKKYNMESASGYKKAMGEALKWLNSDAGKAMTETVSAVSSGLSSVLSEASELIKAELELQTAAIEKRYDTEIEYAEGNSFRVAKLERDKQAEIAKVKNEANRKMFAMQIIQAVAQTAQNALSAFGSAAAIPMVGHIMAPIAAAMALTAGALQIAAIKRQQQASESQGYSSGGFTRPGRVDEPAGIVHAGEWVASQRLVNSPQARPLINALDYAQRTNTIGSLSMADVSRSITAPIVLASQKEKTSSIVVQAPEPSVIVQDNPRLEAIMNRLDARLNEPFVTVNTVVGDHGIQRAQDEFALLMRNKSPKSKR